MARVKKKTYRSLNFTPSQKKNGSQTRELVLTLGNGDVLKIEKIEKSGQRREMSDAEFAELAGDRRAEVGAALEQAYTLGFADALRSELSEGEEDTEEDEEETVRRYVLIRAAGLRRVRIRARKLILGRALRARSTQRQKRPKRSAVRH